MCNPKDSLSSLNNGIFVLCPHFVIDEDFACVKAPPSKKVREDVKQEQKKSLSKSSSQEATSQLSQKNR